MKLLFFLPISEIVSYTNDVSMDIDEKCSDEIPMEGGTFESRNEGLSGQIIVKKIGGDWSRTSERHDYYHECMHVIEVSDSCQKVNFHYRDIALPGFVLYNTKEHVTDDGCETNSFWFSTADTSEFTPHRCECFNEGCSDHDLETYNYDEYSYEYFFTPGFEFDLQYDSSSISDSLSLNSNQFVFYMSKYADSKNAHIIVDWECEVVAATE